MANHFPTPARLKNLLLSLAGLPAEVERLQLQVGDLQARIAQLSNSARPFPDDEFRVFSQFGDDGLIQSLVRRIPSIPNSFIEFGIEDYTESNTRFLLQHGNWRGLVIDASQKYIDELKQRAIYWRHDLSAICSFITAENINSMVKQAGFEGDLGILSIDIDGNDYWIWQAMTTIRPYIVIAEYNAVFGCERAVSVPYDAAFTRTAAHHSNLYWGCSLPALVYLAKQKGYKLVGCNQAGNNAYFVRSEITQLPAADVQAAFVDSKYRESRDPSGGLTYLNGQQRLDAIATMSVVDVTTNQTVACSALAGQR